MICSFDCITYNQKKKIYLQKYIISIQVQAEQGKWVRRERTKATWLTSDMKLNEIIRSIKEYFHI